METSPHWKRIWVTISGRRNTIGTPAARTALNVAKKHLLTGIAMYRPYSRNSFTLCMEKLRDINKPEFKSFMRHLSISLNLDSCICWAMFCNYLKFECFVRVQDISNIVKYIMSTKNIVYDVWQFYALERMFMLKVFQLIVENCENRDHPHFVIYRDFTREITLDNIQENLLKQYSTLSNEINCETHTNCIDITSWVERNSREQLQLLFVILSSLTYEQFDVSTFLQVMKMFRMHNPAFKLYYMDVVTAERLRTLQAIKHVEIAIFLASLSHFWNNHDVWYDRLQDLDHEIVEIYNIWKSPIILLAWVALQLTVPRELASITFEPNLQSYLSTALRFNVFSDLHEMVSNELFKDCLSEVTVKRAIFDILEVLCIKLHADILYDHEGTVTLLGKLLRIPAVAVAWHEGSEDGAKTFYNIAASFFPFHFRPLSIFVKSLVSLKYDTESVVAGLCNLQLYTGKFNNDQESVLEDGERRLTKAFRPFPNDLVVFPVGTKLTVGQYNDIQLISNHGTYSYFRVFLQIVDSMFNQIESRTISPATEEAVISGYELILEIMKVNHQLIKDNDDVKELLRLSYCLLYSTTQSRASTKKLVTLLFEVAMQQFDAAPNVVLKYIIDMKFLPSLKTEISTVQDFFQIQHLIQTSMNRFIREDYHSSTTCDLLNKYIELITVMIKNEMTVVQIVMPSLMFLIIKLFPIYAKEFMTSNVATRNVCWNLVRLIYVVVEKDPARLHGMDLLYFNSLIELFLQNEMYINYLCNICSIGNTKLELKLSGETNLTSGSLLKLVETVKYTLASIMCILNCQRLHTKVENSVLENRLWDSFCSTSVLKHIAGYVSHSFDEEIAKCAFQVFSGFALVSRKPLVQALEYESDEVRHWILECLHDPLLDDEVNISTVHFIRDCVFHQSSMVTAFFNIRSEPVVARHNEESIIECLTDYLNLAEKDSAKLGKPLQVATLELFHIFWKTNRQSIIKKVTDAPNFWTLITVPLLHAEGVPLHSCILTFEILILELSLTYDGMNAPCRDAIDNLFKSCNKFREIWMKRLIGITEVNALNRPRPGQLSLAVTLVTVVKKFILIIRYFYPCYNSVWNIHISELLCLETLLLCIKKHEDVELIALWAELCLLFRAPPEEDESELKERLECMCLVLVHFSDYYPVLNHKCRLLILSLASIILNNSKALIVNNSALAMSFLTPFIRIFREEFENITTTGDNMELRKLEKFYYNWVLILKIANTFLKMENVKECESFYIKTVYLRRICDVLTLFIRNPLLLTVSEVIIASLICYAQSPLNQHFDSIVDNIINKLVPPFSCKLEETTLQTGIVPDHLKCCWRVYSLILRLNGILLKQRGCYIVAQMVQFLEYHNISLSDAILSATVLANEINLQLVCDILHFSYDILKYFAQWPTSNHVAIQPIINSIKKVLNISAHILLSPKILMFIAQFPTVRKVPFVEVPETILVKITSSYLEIITWSCMCLNRYNPSLISLLDMYQPLFQIHVECDFRVPPPINVHQHNLTYNSLLCILQFLCKTLMQITIERRGQGSSSVRTSISEDVEKLFSNYNAIIYPWITRDIVTANTTSFGEPESSGLQTPWLTQLSSEILLQTLIALNTFLAAQAFLTTRNRNVERNVMRYIRRELCSELMFFYDFVHTHMLHKQFPRPSSSNITESRIIATPRKPRSTSKSPTQLPHTEAHGHHLFVDVSRVCTDRKGKRVVIRSIDDCYLIFLTHWFRHVCRLVHHSKFDEFLSQWHAKSTCVMDNKTYVKNKTDTISDEED